MENHALDPITVLRVKTNCCKECPGKVYNALMKIEGVYQVDVAPENKLVSVRGLADPLMLIKTIVKLGKSAELIFYNKEPKIEERYHHKNAQSSGEKHPQTGDYNANDKQNGREKYFCCEGDNSPKMEDFTHEAHQYSEVPTRDDEEDIFKHPYFRFWRTASTNRRMHLRDSDNLFGNYTDQHRQSHFRRQSLRYDDIKKPQHSRWFSEEPFPHEHHHSRMPPSPPPRMPQPGPTYSYGSFGENRLVSDFDNFLHNFSEENPTGCLVM